MRLAWFFLWPRLIFGFPRHALTLCFRFVLKTIRFITGNDPVKYLCIIQKIRWNVNPVFCPVISQYSKHHAIFKEIFLIPKSAVRICRTDSLFISSSSTVHLIFSLSTPSFSLYPYLHLFFVFWAAYFLCHHKHLIVLPWTVCTTQKHSISS